MKANDTDAAFLRDLAERLYRIPVMYGVDQGDIDRLYEIAKILGVNPAEIDPLYEFAKTLKTDTDGDDHGL